MDDGTLDGRLTALAALGDPLRRALYRLVADRHAPVSRDQAAAAAGCSRAAAASHLDRLVHEGLLEAEFRRLGGRRGPGAGRPAKLYRRAGQEISVSLPARHYEVAAHLPAPAVARAAEEGTPVDEVARQVARERGAALAGAARRLLGRRSSRRAQVRAVADVLAGEGYEPEVAGPEIVLANCPFQALAAEHGELVCGMNLALLDGLAGAMPSKVLDARLEPGSGRCCVRLVVEGGPPARAPGRAVTP
jgi:predicted ArsR family transcriptional regulator